MKYVCSSIVVFQTIFWREESENGRAGVFFKYLGENLVLGGGEKSKKSKIFFGENPLINYRKVNLKKVRAILCESLEFCLLLTFKAEFSRQDFPPHPCFSSGNLSSVDWCCFLRLFRIFSFFRYWNRFCSRVEIR